MVHTRQALCATATALLFVAVGCSPPDDVGDGAGHDGTDQVDEIIVAYSSDVDTLDPHQFRSNASFGVVGNIYATLLQEEFSDPEGGVLEHTGDSTPYLAETATWNDAKTKLTFTLRPGLTFADGSPITANDVVFSMQRALSDVGIAQQVGTWINVEDAATDIVAVDETTIEFRVTHFSPLIESLLSFQLFAILDESAVKEAAAEDDPWATGFLAQEATESGPYVVESQAAGQTVTLVKNDKYTATDLADAPDRVVVKHISDPQQAFLALQNGAVDLVVGLTPDVAQTVEQDPNLTLYDLAYSDSVHLGMNSADPVFKDARVRRAISYLIPYDTLRENVMKGYAGAAYGIVPYPMPDAIDTTGERAAYDTDVVAAKNLLDDAGISEGELSLTLSVPASDPVLRESAVFIQSALQEVGIEVTVDVMSDADFNSNLGKLQMYVHSWASLGQDSVFQMFFLMKSGVFTNYTNFSDEDVDRLLAEAMATTDVAERRELSQQAQRIIIEQAPWAFLFTRNMLIGAQANISGITHSNDAVLRFDQLRVAN